MFSEKIQQKKKIKLPSYFYHSLVFHCFILILMNFFILSIHSVKKTIPLKIGFISQAIPVKLKPETRRVNQKLEISPQEKEIEAPKKEKPPQKVKTIAVATTKAPQVKKIPKEENKEPNEKKTEVIAKKNFGDSTPCTINATNKKFSIEGPKKYRNGWHFLSFVEGHAKKSKGKLIFESKMSKIQNDIKIFSISGEYDKMDNILNSYSIPYTKLNQLEFKKLLLASSDTPATKSVVPYFNPRKHLIILNCVPILVTKKESQALNKFVQKGGYLCSIDSSIRILAKTFPNRLSRKKVNSRLFLTGIKLNKRHKHSPLFNGFNKKKEAFNAFNCGLEYSELPELSTKRSKILAYSKKGYPIIFTFQVSEKDKAKKSFGRILHFTFHLDSSLQGKRTHYLSGIIFANFILLKQAKYRQLLKQRSTK